MKKIYFFSRYGSYAASSRLRFEAIAQKINIEDCDIIESPLFKLNYLAFSKFYFAPFLLFYFLFSYLKRIFVLFSMSNGHIAFIQYELFPFIPPFFESYLHRKGVKLILDFDDAFFHSYDNYKGNIYFNSLRGKYSFIISLSDHVITGSPYLTSYVSSLSSSVSEIPTCVVSIEERICFSQRTVNIFTIGWIGSASTSKYIDQIARPIQDFLNIYSSRLILIGYSGSEFKNNHNVQLVNWNEQNERFFLPQIDVGIMPLTDDKWSRGKCGFKLIQYMSYGKPTISTPLEANLKIDGSGGNLFASSAEEWSLALLSVYKNLEKYHFVGITNLKRVKQNYLFEVVVPQYDMIFKNCLNVQN